MDFKVLASPGSDELGPACEKGDSAPDDMSIECCHVYAVLSELPWFSHKETVLSVDSEGVSDGIETDYDCRKADDGPEELFFGLHFI